MDKDVRNNGKYPVEWSVRAGSRVWIQGGGKVMRWRWTYRDYTMWIKM